MPQPVSNDDHLSPLSGIRMVEYGVFHAGPGAGAILGDLGADVIKIEAGAGDPERYWSRVGQLDMSLPNGQSFMYEISNRNKRGIYLDITTEKGRAILHRLVKGADVFLTNLRQSTKNKLSLDYQTLSQINPKLIHISVSGYGPNGPLRDMGAFDPMGQARSGMVFVTGSEHPALLHLGILDQAAAIAASHAIITALLVRERRGIGQEVNVSLYGTALWLQYINLIMSTAMRVNATVTEDRRHHSPLRNCFRCGDGKYIIGTHHPEDKYWPTFCRITGQEALIDDPRYATEPERSKHYPELLDLFDQVFMRKTRDEWMEIFEPSGLMFTGVQRIQEVETDVQALVNDYIVPFDHPLFGRINLPGYPIQFSAGRAYTRTAAPGLGQHTAEILAEIGYNHEEIQSLAQEGVVKLDQSAGGK